MVYRKFLVDLNLSKGKLTQIVKTFLEEIEADSIDEAAEKLGVVLIKQEELKGYCQTAECATPGEIKEILKTLKEGNDITLYLIEEGD